ncbi:MAG: hypothetical protein ACP6IS_04475 [Candidatus Asgardarchaeia archaeon]
MIGETAKELAELRSFVQRQIEETEKKIRDLEYELQLLKRSLEIIDKLLLQESFKPAAELMPETEELEEVGIGKEETRTLKSKDGKTLAKVIISDNKVIITPIEELEINPRSDVLTNFFVNKVLMSLHRDDLEAIKEGKLAEGDEIDYEILTKGRLLEKIIVKNYRTDSRLRRILNALRWTLEEMAKTGHHPG